MKTLKEILDLIGIEDFNDMVITVLSGDADYISESLPEQGLINAIPQNWIDKLNHAGINSDNFPWEEIEAYVEKIQEHLKTHLILKL